MRLRRIVVYVQVAALGRNFLDRGRGGRLPVAEQPAGEVFQGLPFESPRHAEDGPPGLEPPREELLDLRQIDRFQGLLLAQRRAVPRAGKMAAAKLDHELRRGLVFDRPQVLQHVLPAGLQLLGGQARALDDVGKDGQRGGQVLGQRGPAVGNPRARHRGVMVNAQVVQVDHELAVVAGSRPAERHLADERGQAQAGRRLVDAAGRHQQGERGRLQPGHRLGHKHQAVGENVRGNGGCQGCHGGDQGLNNE